MFRLSQLILISSLCANIIAAKGNLSADFLAHEAALVVRATVDSKTVKRDAEKRIVTEVELRISETWKGKAPGKTLTLIHPGGVLGEEIAVASGQPTYQINEEVILFLAPNDRGQFVTIGVGNGKFHVNNSGTKATAANSYLAPVSVSELKGIVSKNQ